MTEFSLNTSHLPGYLASVWVQWTRRIESNISGIIYNSLTTYMLHPIEKICSIVLVLQFNISPLKILSHVVHFNIWNPRAFGKSNRTSTHHHLLLLHTPKSPEDKWAFIIYKIRRKTNGNSKKKKRYEKHTPGRNLMKIINSVEMGGIWKKSPRKNTVRIS